MERTYLYVSPEEYAEVKASGACWDDRSKSWYIDKNMAPATFARWLRNDAAAFNITSDEAFVARAQVSCVMCRKIIHVICIHCSRGIDGETDERLAQFTVSNIGAMDAALAQQLVPWPDFRKGIGADSEEGFANHCPHCGAVQDDYLLHAEPGDVFFGLALERPGPVEFTPLKGRVQLSGDYGFEV